MLISQDRVFCWVFFLLLIVIIPMQLCLAFAQPTPNPLLSQPDSVKILISNLTINKSPSGFISVTGTLQNNSTEEIERIMVNVTFYDNNKNIEREISRYVSGPFTIYSPNSTERFSFIIGKVDYQHYEAKAFATRVR